MNIPDTALRNKGLAVLAIIFLIGSLGFYLGQRTAQANRPVGDSLWIEQLPEEELPSASSTEPQAALSNASQAAAAAAAADVPSESASGIAQGSYVASKSGSKYYLPSCGTASRIKEENKVWFSTKAEAEAAGYEPAANCKGL